MFSFCKTRKFTLLIKELFALKFLNRICVIPGLKVQSQKLLPSVQQCSVRHTCTCSLRKIKIFKLTCKHNLILIFSSLTF